MFSLIITVISIALVAALALATLYYGGSAFNKGAADAEASRILLQGQQILGATELYFTDHRAWPASLQVLVDENYLKAIPTVMAAPMGEATAAQAEWTMPQQNPPLFMLATSTADVCKKANKRAWGVEGILTTPHTAYPTQCFGDTTFKTVVARSGEAVAAAHNNPSVGPVTAGGAPLDNPDHPAWKVHPANGDNGGGNGGNGGDGEGGEGEGGGEEGGGTPAAAVISLSVTDVAYGARPLNTVSPTQVVVSNTGNAAFSFSQAPTLAGNAAFTLSSNTCTGTLAADAQCLLGVTFTPTGFDAVSGTLTFQGGSQTYQVSLSGSGSGAIVSLSGATLAFGERLQASAAALHLVVSNTGNVPFSFSQAAAVAGNAAFALASNSCGASLAAGSQCTMTVNFTPSGTAAVAGTLEFNANGTPYVIDLSGSGAAVPVSLSVGSVNFGAQSTYGSGYQSPVVMTNNHSGAVTFSDATSSLPEFSVDLTACLASYGSGNGAFTLPAGQSCTWSAVFSPTTAAALQAQLTFSSSVGQVTVAASGSGDTTPPAAPEFDLSTSFLQMNSANVTPASATFQVTNSGSAPVSSLALTLKGSNLFATSHNCPATLTTSQSCTVTVAFGPTNELQDSSGFLQVSADSAPTETIRLYGSRVSCNAPAYCKPVRPAAPVVTAQTQYQYQEPPAFGLPAGAWVSDPNAAIQRLMTHGSFFCGQNLGIREVSLNGSGHPFTSAHVRTWSSYWGTQECDLTLNYRPAQ